MPWAFDLMLACCADVFRALAVPKPSEHRSKAAWNNWRNSIRALEDSPKFVYYRFPSAFCSEMGPETRNNFSKITSGLVSQLFTTADIFLTTEWWMGLGHQKIIVGPLNPKPFEQGGGQGPSLSFRPVVPWFMPQWKRL